jgi:hypothetical protein
MERRTEHAGVSELVDAMLEVTAPITQALDHMVRAPGQPDIDAAVEVLRGLLRDVIEPLGTILAPRDLRTTTAVLEATVPLIIDGLYLVPHDVHASGARHAARETPRPRGRSRQRSRKRGH